MRCAFLLCAVLPLSAVDDLLVLGTDVPVAGERRLVLRLEGMGPPRPDGVASTAWITAATANGALDPATLRITTEVHQRTRFAVDACGLRLEGDAVQGGLTFRWMGVDPFAPPPADALDKRPPMTVAITAQLRNDDAPWQEDPTPSMPPWRKEAPVPGGWTVAGTWTMAERSGDVGGGWGRLATPGSLGGDGMTRIAGTRADGRIAATVVLPPTRRAAPCGSRLVAVLPTPCDLSGHAALRLDVQGPVRPGVCLSVRLRTAGGVWWGVDEALPLDGRTTGYTVDLDLFRHVSGFNDYRFRREAIDAVAVGCDDPRGVGAVAFSLGAVAATGARPAVAPAVVTIGGAWLEHDGATRIPDGLFGLHDVRGPAKDRSNDDVLRALRPGSLRWVEHGDLRLPKPRDPAKPRKEPKAPKIRTPEEIEKRRQPTPSEWRQRLAAAGAEDRTIVAFSWDLLDRPPWLDDGVPAWEEHLEQWYPQVGAMAAGSSTAGWLPAVEVFNEPFIWARHINAGPLLPKGATDVRDPTQHGHMPAALAADAYARFFLAARRGVDAAATPLRFGGPSAPAFHDDLWDAWTGYTALILDRIHHRLDYLTEHHYQGAPASYAASYLMAALWCEQRYGRRIPIWNTEANDLVDTPNKGDDGGTPPWAVGADQSNRVHYNAVDILACIRACPDVVMGRTVHGLWDGAFRNPGELHVYTLLAGLRGRMLPVAFPDDVLAAAALGAGDRGCIVLINRRDQPRPLDLRLPAGWRVTGVQAVTATPGVGTALETLDGVPALLPPLLPIRIDIAVDAQPTRTLRRTTVATPLLLAPVRPDAPAAATIAVPPAERAWLRLVLEGVHAGEGTCTVGGQAVMLPAAGLVHGDVEVIDLPVEPARLGPATSLVFTSSGDGYRVVCSAILTERATGLGPDGSAP
jgi:uncharacterized protein YbdZ (MbtH family)